MSRNKAADSSRMAGTGVVAHFATVLVAMQKDILSAGVAEDIDARVTGDVFGAVAPEDNLFLQVEHAHADLQAVEDVAVSIGIAKGWHGGVEVLLAYFIGRNRFWLQRRR
jgi:hypothetical protein